MLLIVCAREALRDFRRLDGPEPLVMAGFDTGHWRNGFNAATFENPACRQTSRERRQAHLLISCQSKPADA
jgi:hypothetical protein